MGWTYANVGANPAPTIDGGELAQGPTTSACSGAIQSWSREDVPFDFDQTFVFEVELRVISSNYVAGTPCGDNGCGGPSWKPGYLIALRDQAERKLFIGTTDSGVIFDPTTCCFCPSAVPVLPFDMTDGLHLYRLEVSQGEGRLYVDGQLFASHPVSSFIPDPASPNLIIFGDATHQGASQTRLQLLRFTSDPSALPAAVPMGSELSLVRARRRLEAGERHRRPIARASIRQSARRV